ncbi:MAG: metallophosphoesterase [Candidatus Melainabacteria bacterium]|nr:metallophosphoesterase [Candidatus Melainabacteria bacterium]
MQKIDKKSTFYKAAIMSYASASAISDKAHKIFSRLKKVISSQELDEDLYVTDDVAYIPDVHGDFIHLALTLYRHGLIDKNLELVAGHKYVFLGDIYDRAPDSDVIDYWLNNQINNNKEIYRLIGNHELAFFLRGEDGSPIIFPSQDSIKDISNNFCLTEQLLQGIASGHMLAAYVDETNTKGESVTLYVHSYVTDDDFLRLGLDADSDIVPFAQKLNERFKKLGENALGIFQDGKKSKTYHWKSIMEVFHKDSLFDFYGRKNDIDTSFIWRRTGLPLLKTYPAALDVSIPNNVYQIVGHTPVFLFNLPSKQPTNVPFVLSASAGNGKVQFSDVGIGYYYREDDLARPSVIINKDRAIEVT